MMLRLSSRSSACHPVRPDVFFVAGCLYRRTLVCAASERNTAPARCDAFRRRFVS